MKIDLAAKREMARMEKIFQQLEIIEKGKAEEFYSFAKNYFEDGKYFFAKKKYVEAFEAFIISWAYLDIGLKLNLFIAPEQIKKYFTVD
jgi:hypothetical protein